MDDPRCVVGVQNSHAGGPTASDDEADSRRDGDSPAVHEYVQMGMVMNRQGLLPEYLKTGGSDIRAGVGWEGPRGSGSD